MGLQRIIFDIFQLAMTDATLRYEDQLVKIRVVFSYAYLTVAKV